MMPDVAGKLSAKLKRQTRTLGQAIGAVVTELRLKKKWSQGQLAAKSGYSDGWINQLENGKTNPTMALVIVMTDIFGLKLSQFFARAERRQKKKQPKAGGDSSAKPDDSKAKAGS